MPDQLRFISVAGRELRVIARRKRTFVIRWVSVAAFFAFLVWLIWVLDGFKRAGVGSDIFHAFATVVFFYCLIVGTAQTADCISSEKREGTLGLLFLTNLNSAEIVAGKLCSTALPTVYGLLAIFPMLGIPMLMGGVTVGEFWRSMLALLDAILFALSCGFVASVICKRQFAAIAVALALAIGVGAGLMAAAAIVAEFPFSKRLVDALSIFSPLYTLASADGGRPIGRPNLYWQSLAAVAGLSLLGLGFVTWRLSRVWQDRPKAARLSFRFDAGQRWKQRGATGRAAMRRRLLDINPFYWLAGRSRVSSPVFMVVILLLVLFTVHVTAPYFTSVIPAGAMKPVVGSMFAWFFSGLFLHVLVLYYAAMISSQRLAEDRHAGALELILSTPTTERDISRGLWLAFFRRMTFPALAAVTVHFYFIWQVMHAMIMDAPGNIRIPQNIGPWELFWTLLTSAPGSGRNIDWQIGFMLQIVLLFLVMMVVIWFTLALVGRWLGLRMKLAGFAPLVSLALVFIPPVILFSVVCFFIFEIQRGGSSMPERQLLPLLLWAGFSIGVLHCILLGAWASGKLRQEFRSAVIGRAESARRRWIPSLRTVLRFIGGSVSYAIVLAIVITGFYGCQNRQSKRAWTTFQSRLQKKGESLDVAPLIPAPVADGDNFAKSPAFAAIKDSKDKTFRMFVNRMGSLDVIGYGQSKNTFRWVEQQPMPLEEFTRWLHVGPLPGSATNNASIAPLLLKLTGPHTNSLRALATAARLPSFQIVTNRDALAVINKPELQMFERLHFLFVIRATSLLETGGAAEAAEDFLTSLDFARLARQSPDMNSSARTRMLLARSFQPLWEGLAKHQWNESQLAEFEAALSQFNLLADHTNTVRRVALAYISEWKSVPEAPAGKDTFPASGGANLGNTSWQMHPRQWWLNCCIQLHQVAEEAIGQVDVDGERVEMNDSWRDLSELPLDSEAQGLFGQYYWQGIDPTLVAFAQTSLNQARLAIALERFRIANGRYPATSNELMPAYLDRIPRDVMRGLPLIFQRLDDDHYILRGTGSNGKDDRKSKAASDDWLWAYPTNAPAAATSP